MDFAKRIKNLREEKKHTQAEVATRLGIARTTYASYEQGFREPDNDMLKKIAEYFDVTIDFLVGRTDLPQTTEEAKEPLAIRTWLRTGNPDLNEKERDELAEDLEKYFAYRKQRILDERKGK